MQQEGRTDCVEPRLVDVKDNKLLTGLWNLEL
mgnify:CR=1 FL=1